MHTTDITNPKRIALARRVSEVMPEGLRGNCHTSFFQAGSDAVETAIKFARKYTGRSQIVAFQGAYHGVWCGTSALTTGYNYRHGWGPLIPGVTHVPYAYCYRCAFDMTYPHCEHQCGKYVDYVLNTPTRGMDDVAAVIVESQQGEGGYVAPAAGVLPDHQGGLREVRLSLRRRRGAVGRRAHGQDVGIEHAGVVPDMLTWGKGMGGDLPMAGLTYRAEYRGEAHPEARSRAPSRATR